MGPGRRATIRLGSVRGVPIAATPSVPVVVAVIVFVLSGSVLPDLADGYPSLYYVTSACLAALLFFASLLAHELGHGLVARRAGVAVRSVTLWALGGQTEMDGEPPTPRAAFRVAAAGPLMSALVAAVCLGLGWLLSGSSGGNLTADVFLAVGWLNLALAVLNLLPGAPLDGGRMLRAVVWWRTGDRDRGAMVSAQSGRFLGLTLVVVGMFDVLRGANLGGLWILLAGWFLMTAATVEWQRLRLAAAMDGIKVRDVMGPPPAVGFGRLTVEDFLADVVLPSGQRVFAVLSFDGGLDGIVTLPMLQVLPVAQRGERRVQTLCIPMARVVTAGPDEPASVLLERIANRPSAGVVLVLEPQPRSSRPQVDIEPSDLGLVGLVTAHELSHAMTVAPLRRQADAAARRSMSASDREPSDGQSLRVSSSGDRPTVDGGPPCAPTPEDTSAGQRPPGVPPPD